MCTCGPSYSPSSSVIVLLIERPNITCQSITNIVQRYFRIVFFGIDECINEIKEFFLLFRKFFTRWPFSNDTNDRMTQADTN